MDLDERAKKVTLKDGTELKFVMYDSAGPNSKLKLNSTSLFVKISDSNEWIKCNYQIPLHRLELVLSWCNNISDVQKTFGF